MERISPEGASVLLALSHDLAGAVEAAGRSSSPCMPARGCHQAVCTGVRA